MMFHQILTMPRFGFGCRPEIFGLACNTQFSCVTDDSGAGAGARCDNLAGYVGIEMKIMKCNIWI